MRSEINIGRRTISRESPVFIVAEAGVTCNYDLKIAKELIDVVHDSGADAIKFIFWFPEEIMSDRTTVYRYETVDGPREENMYEMLQGLRFSLDQWREIKAYADQREVILFSTVNSPSGILWAEEIGLDAYKLSSWDFNYHRLFRRIATLGKPMIIDTGPVHMWELARVLQILIDSGNDKCVLVHCFHTTDPAEMNMLSIPYMARVFRTLAGYSAPGREDWQDIMALTTGAVYLEKRLTMSRSLPGHHHVISLEPGEFAQYVLHMRRVQAALGVEDLIPSKGDLSERRRWFRHLVAARDIPVGTVLSEEMMEAKRLEEGISPVHEQLLIGRRTKRDLKQDESLSWDVV